MTPGTCCTGFLSIRICSTSVWSGITGNLHAVQFLCILLRINVYINISTITAGFFCHDSQVNFHDYFFNIPLIFRDLSPLTLFLESHQPRYAAPPGGQRDTAQDSCNP